MHSSIHAWKTPWTEELSGLQSTGHRRVRHNLVTKTATKIIFFIPLGPTQTLGQGCCVLIYYRLNCVTP